MKDIFADLYNKVLGFFKQTEKNHDNAKDVACNRLKLVLMQDRTNLNPQLLERMRGELIDLLSKYVEMDKEALELNFEQEGDQMALMLSIPVIKAKDEEEIEATLKKEEEEKKALEEAAKLAEEAEIVDENEEDCEFNCDECEEEDCECRDCEKDSCEGCEVCDVEDELDSENCPEDQECVCEEEIDTDSLEEVDADYSGENETETEKAESEEKSKKKSSKKD